MAWVKREVAPSLCVPPPPSPHTYSYSFLIITLFVIPFMQGIYNYTPATNYVSRVYSVAADLYLQFVHVMLCRP